MVIIIISIIFETLTGPFNGSTSRNLQDSPRILKVRKEA